MSWQELAQVLFGNHWANSRSTTTVRDAESLVQVQVRDIAPELAKLGKPNYCIGVGPIDVNLTTGCVNQVANLNHCLFIDTVCGGVSDHQSGERIAVLGDLGLQVSNINVAVFIAGNHNDFHTSQHGARCVRAVGAGWNQTDVALEVPAGAVVAANCQQSS